MAKTLTDDEKHRLLILVKQANSLRDSLHRAGIAMSALKDLYNFTLHVTRMFAEVTEIMSDVDGLPKTVPWETCKNAPKGGQELDGFLAMTIATLDPYLDGQPVGEPSAPGKSAK